MPNNINSSSQFFLDIVSSLKVSEEKLQKSLTELLPGLTNLQLIDLVETFSQLSKDRIQNLDRVYQLVGLDFQPESSKAIDGLLSDIDSLLNNRQGNSDIDLGIILSLQVISSYLLYYYSYASNLVSVLNLNNQAIDVLNKSFAQVESFNSQLNSLAEALFTRITSKTSAVTQTPVQSDIEKLKTQIEEQQKQVDQISQLPPEKQAQQTQQLQQQLTQQQQEIKDLEQSNQMEKPSSTQSLKEKAKQVVKKFTE